MAGANNSGRRTRRGKVSSKTNNDAHAQREPPRNAEDVHESIGQPRAYSLGLAGLHGQTAGLTKFLRGSQRINFVCRLRFGRFDYSARHLLTNIGHPKFSPYHHRTTVLSKWPRSRETTLSLNGTHQSLHDCMRHGVSGRRWWIAWNSGNCTSVTYGQLYIAMSQ